MASFERARRRREAREEYARLKPEERLGDAPIEEQYHDEMRRVAYALDEMFNGPRGGDYVKRTGFVLMVFPFEGFDGRCNYMSNGASREDIVTLMREMIARFEGQPEVKGTA